MKAIFLVRLSLVCILSMIQYSLASEQGAVFMVPASVQKLDQYEDKNSIEYQVAASQAAHEVVQLGKSYLSQQDSGTALKLLVAGAAQLPWRGDIISLKNTALKTFLRVTNALIDDAGISCTVILDRVRFIEQISPDAILEIKRTRCQDEKSLRPLKTEYLKDITKIMYVSVPGRHPEIEAKNPVDLIDQLEFYITKNSSLFPYEYVVRSSMGPLIALLGNQSFLCGQINLDPDSLSANDIYLIGKCSINWNFSKEVFNKALEEHCQRMEDLLFIPQGSQSIKCGGKVILTSKPLFDHLKGFDNKFPNLTFNMNYSGGWGVDDNLLMIPPFVVTEIKYNKTSGTSFESLFHGKNNAAYLAGLHQVHMLNPDFQQSVLSRQRHYADVENNWFPRLSHTSDDEINLRLALYDKNSLPVRMGAFKKEEVKGLTSIDYAIDVPKTYENISRYLINRDGCPLTKKNSTVVKLDQQGINHCEAFVETATLLKEFVSGHLNGSLINEIKNDLCHKFGVKRSCR